MSAENILYSSFTGPFCIDRNPALGIPFYNQWYICEREQAVKVDQLSVVDGCQESVAGIRYTIGIVDIPYQIFSLNRDKATEVLLMSFAQKSSFPDPNNPLDFKPMVGSHVFDWGFDHRNDDVPTVNIEGVVDFKSFHHSQESIGLGNFGAVEYFDYKGQTVGKIRSNSKNRPVAYEDDHIRAIQLLAKHFWYKKEWALLTPAEREVAASEFEGRSTSLILYELARRRRAIGFDREKAKSNTSQMNQLLTETDGFSGPSSFDYHVLGFKMRHVNKMMMESASMSFIHFCVKNKIPFMASRNKRMLLFDEDNYQELDNKRVNVIGTSPMRQIEDLATQMNMSFFMRSESKSGVGKILFSNNDLIILMSPEISQTAKLDILNSAWSRWNLAC